MDSGPRKFASASGVWFRQQVGRPLQDSVDLVMGKANEMFSVELAADSVTGDSFLRVRLRQERDAVDAPSPRVRNLNRWRMSFDLQRLLMIFRDAEMKSVAKMVQFVKRVLHRQPGCAEHV